MYSTHNPIHPDFELTRYQVKEPKHGLVPGALSYQILQAAEEDEPDSHSSGMDNAIDGLLGMHREGIDALATELNRLLGERRDASEQIFAGIDRDQTYLENLILDRYVQGARPTDDPTYVNLRLQQLRLGSDRRREQSGFWKDTVLLAKELSELLRRSDEARRREELLGGDGL